MLKRTRAVRRNHQLKDRKPISEDGGEGGFVPDHIFWNL